MWRYFIPYLFFSSLASSSDVLELNQGNFETVTRQHDIMLIEFYAPWCGHCKALAPKYEIAATELKSTDPPVPLAKVDCTAETDICSKYGVSGYPTLKIFKSGELSSDYNGPREADGIVKYMLSKAGPSSLEFNEASVLEAKLSKLPSKVVGFFESADSELYKVYKSAADALSEDFSFMHTFDSKVMTDLGKKESIILYLAKPLRSKFEDNEKEYKGTKTIDAIKIWVRENYFGLAGPRTSDNARFYDSRRPLVIAFYDVDFAVNAKQTNYWRNRVMKVAKPFTESQTLYLAVSSSKSMGHELSEYGVDTPGDKVTIIGRNSQDQKFKMDEEFSMPAFEKWLTKFLNNELEPYLKSEPIPDSNDEPVKVVVAKNFEQIVNNPDKDVLIEFYAPWCGHCKNLAPKYDELATKLKDEPEIVIAKMDATANDVPPQYQVQGFPTLYFAPKGSKTSPKQYDGGREVDDFVKYLAKQSTNPLKGFERDGTPKKTEL